MNNKHNRSHALLVEILIAVLFFMIAATVLVRVFVASHHLTVRSGVETQALEDAQNVADVIYAAEDINASLKDMGFLLSHGVWTREADNGTYTLYVEGNETPTEAGRLWNGTVRAFYSVSRFDAFRQQEEELFVLECTRYRGEPQ